MKSALFGLLAETAVHSGTEASGGLIDLPVAREAVTNYPLLPGSSLKGTLRSAARSVLSEPEVEQLFGKPDSAGTIAITDARLLLLPVRSLTSHFVWVTCPYILERLVRDLMLVGHPLTLTLEEPEDNQVYAATEAKLYLEELTLQAVARPDMITAISDAIKPLIYHETVRNSLAKHLVVVSKDRMHYFASYCLQVRARNQLDINTKISKYFWYEESLPSDTLLYFAMLQRPEHEGNLERVASLFAGNPYLQVGGNETVGQGWCIISRYGEGE
ncbi:MAG: type III-B CRISPR module RAMP protein Cmr4 [Bacillota bacterium]